MFDVLLASRPAPHRRLWSAAALSFGAHVALIGGALGSAQRSVGAAPPPDHTILIPFVSGGVRPQTGDPVPPPAPGRIAIDPPTTIPPAIPLPDLGGRSDPGDLRWGAAVSGGGGPGGVDPSMVYRPALVEELPELLLIRRAYPPLLRQAGIAGQVVVRVVIDTTGHVEPGSVEIVSSTHVEFTRAAHAMLSGALFRPAKVTGRPVRVRIELPVTFNLR